MVRYQKLHYSYLRLHLHGHKHLPWGPVSFLQPKQHNKDHIYLHTAHPVLSIHPTILGASSPVHFLSTTHALCAPFAWSYHRNSRLRHSSYLCVALFVMISAHTGLGTSTSTAFAPCTPSGEPPTSSLPSLWAWLFPADGIRRIASQIRGFTPG